LLSLIFKLKGNLYAIDVNNIGGISLLPDEVVPMPSSQLYVKGIVKIHDKLITVVDLRELLNMSSLESDYLSFKNMLDLRKKDHINWVNTLCECVRNKESFTLTTDPHKCALGKWLDNFKSESESINFHLSKLSVPHSQLHRDAIKIFGFQKEAGEKSERLIKRELNYLQNELMPSILNLIDETKNVFLSEFKSLLLCLDYEGNKSLGVLVDEVLGVEKAQFIHDDNELTAINVDLISGMAKTVKSEQLVTVLSSREIIRQFTVDY